MGEDLTEKKEEERAETISGFVRVVSENEADITLATGKFISNEVFEVRGGCIPKTVFQTITTSDNYKPHKDYRRVLYFPISALNEKNERLEHPNYHPKNYPAVFLPLAETQKFKPGELVDITETVKAGLASLNPEAENYEESLASLSNNPIIDDEGKPLTQAN